MAYLNAKNFVGRMWRLVYTGGTAFDSRLVYCYSSEGDTIHCWDFTNDGYRNFNVASIQNPVEFVNFRVIKDMPKYQVAFGKELAASFRQDKKAAFYNSQTGDVIVVKAEDGIGKSTADTIQNEFDKADRKNSLLDKKACVMFYYSSRCTWVLARVSNGVVEKYFECKTFAEVQAAWAQI